MKQGGGVTELQQALGDRPVAEQKQVHSIS